MRCLICDDHPLMRQALVTTIRGHWPDAMVQEATSYHQAWSLIEDAPDLCLVDLAMPGAEPCEGVARLRALAPATAILVVTGLGDEQLLNDIRRCGVAAILPKTLEPEEMVAAIDDAMQRTSSPPAAVAHSSPRRLPPRQTAVLRLMSQGLTNKEIAARLLIAPATVKIHVSRIIEHLGASNRTDAVARAQLRGII